MALPRVLVTLTEQGMMLFEPGRLPYHIQTRADEVFDVSGAGDTAIAVFTDALAGGRPLPPKPPKSPTTPAASSSANSGRPASARTGQASFWPTHASPRDVAYIITAMIAVVFWVLLWSLTRIRWYLENDAAETEDLSSGSASSLHSCPDGLRIGHVARVCLAA